MKYHYMKIWAFPDRIENFNKLGWKVIRYELGDLEYIPENYPAYMAIIRKIKSGDL